MGINDKVYHVSTARNAVWFGANIRNCSQCSFSIGAISLRAAGMMRFHKITQVATFRQTRLHFDAILWMDQQPQDRRLSALSVPATLIPGALSAVETCRCVSQSSNFG